MKNKFSYFLSVLLSFFFTLSVFAQSGYTLLADIPTVTKKTDPGLVVYMKGLFTLFVGMAIVFAVIMIILGAMGYILAAVPSAKADGKNKMMAAVYGLLLVLFSTILLNTLNPDLLKIGIKLNMVDKTPSANTNSGSNNGSTNNGQSTAIGDGGASGNEQGNRDFLTSRGITINAEPPQTVMSGVNQTTLNEVSRLKMTCPSCDVIVTAGSESGHTAGTYSHANGYKVDLRSKNTDTTLSQYIQDENKSGFTYKGTTDNGWKQYTSPTGAVYTYETTNEPHWDVLVTGECGDAC